MDINQETIKKLTESLEAFQNLEKNTPLKKRIKYFLAKIILLFQEKIFKQKGKISCYMTMIEVSKFINKEIKKDILYKIGTLKEVEEGIELLNKVSCRDRGLKIKKIKFLKDFYYYIQEEYSNEKEWQKKVEESIKNGEAITIEL